MFVVARLLGGALHFVTEMGSSNTQNDDDDDAVREAVFAATPDFVSNTRSDDPYFHDRCDASNAEKSIAVNMAKE
jgi:hypothetical protein